MRETISIATMFLLLAFAGVERGQPEGANICNTGIVPQMIRNC